jgi:hypothetical protein
VSKATLPLRLVEDSLGKDKIRYFLYLNGRWRWRPSKAMRACEVLSPWAAAVPAKMPKAIPQQA